MNFPPQVVRKTMCRIGDTIWIRLTEFHVPTSVRSVRSQSGDVSVFVHESEGGVKIGYEVSFDAVENWVGLGNRSLPGGVIAVTQQGLCEACKAGPITKDIQSIFTDPILRVLRLNSKDVTRGNVFVASQGMTYRVLSE